jgi:DNA-binding response OmpR family regulator
MTKLDPSSMLLRARKRVLVVDDDLDAGNILAELIGAAGHQALLARTCEAALTQACEEAPDVVLLDRYVAGRDAWTLVYALRLIARTPLVVLATSGQGTVAACNHAREGGCDGFFRKPVRWSTLLAAIEGRRDPVAPDGFFATPAPVARSPRSM